MATTTQTPAAITTWKLDPAHSHAEFKVKHMMISNVKGSFSGLSGVLTENPADPAQSSVDASIDISSVNTGDAQQYPTMTFKSTSVKPNGDGGYNVTGDLSIHGQTRQQIFVVDGPSAPTKDPWGNTRIGLSATTKISRKDFGLNWNVALETGGILVGDDVNITLEVQFIKA